MKKYFKKNNLKEVICDSCKNSCKKEFDFEYATLNAHWGYGSKKDGDVYQIDLCEDCFDKISDFLKIKPTKNDVL